MPEQPTSGPGPRLFEAHANARAPRWAPAWIVVAGLAAFLPYLGQTWEIGARELRHAQVAREMAEGGSWLVPTLFGVEYRDKPPVMHAAIAIAYRVAGGQSLALARLPSAVAAVAAAVALHGVGLAVVGDGAAALLAAMMLLAAFEYQHMARMVRPDMTLVLLMMSSCWAVTTTVRAASVARVVLGLLAGLLAGVATVTKGPIGLGVPALFLLLVGRDGRSGPSARVMDLVAFGLGAVVAVAAWAIPVWQVDGGGYLHRVLTQPDLVGEEAGERPPWWYLGTVAVGFLPFSLLLPALIGDLRRRGWSIAIAMAAVVLVVISCVPKKRAHYALPMYPFLALALASAVERHAVRWLRTAAIALAALALLAGPARFAWLGSRGASESKWRTAEHVLAVVPSGARIVAMDELGEAIAFRGHGVAVAEAYGAAQAIETVGRLGPGTYLLVPGHLPAGMVAHLHSALALSPILQLDGQNGRRWDLLQFGS